MRLLGLLLLYLSTAGFALEDEEPPARFLLNDPFHVGFENCVNVDHTNLNLINLQLKTVFLIHGSNEDASEDYHTTFPAEYALKGQYNVIAVDWGKIAFGLYTSVVYKTKKVGDFVGRFIHAAGMSPKLVHCVGLSLGAHVCGFASQYVCGATGEKMARISGLDPAGPGFIPTLIGNNAHLRLSEDDADMVDVLHCDAIAGTFTAIGTVDFYANGGFGCQPGCPNSPELVELVFCAHRRCMYLYIEAINSHRFVACSSKEDLLKCPSGNQIIYGDGTPSNATNVYYFNTNAKPPYAQGDGNKYK